MRLSSNLVCRSTHDEQHYLIILPYTSLQKVKWEIMI